LDQTTNTFHYSIGQLGRPREHRRKFFEAAIAIKGENRAREALLYIRKIYAVEWQCKDRNDQQRKAYRMEYAKPILDAFKTRFDNQVDAVLPKSP
jgi:hypothetical protein